MTNAKMVGMLAAAFVAGSFLASPELRAYASTIANDVICNGCVGTSDLAGGAVTNAKLANGGVNSAKIADNSITGADIGANAVGASEIATDAVGASELVGLTKFIFGQCTLGSAHATQSVAAGFLLEVPCNISGVDTDDSVLATLNGGHGCFDMARAAVFSNGQVTVFMRNECSFTVQIGSSARIGIMVYDK